MNPIPIALASLALAVALPGLAHAQTRQASRCTATVVARTPADQDPTFVLVPGQTWGPPTQMVVDRATGRASYCAHGSYCYAAGGLRLSGCTVSGTPMPPITGAGDEPWIYAVR